MIKPIHTVLAACFVLSTFGSAFAGSERYETLQAINWVENPTNHARRGSKGELGPYQFMPTTWSLHTRKSFNLAVVREHADDIAVRHYEWIRRELTGAGIDPNPYNIAMAWNCGVGAVKSGRIPRVSYHYAERVQNLVEMQRNRRAATRASVAATSVVRPGKSAAVTFSLKPSAPRFVIATAEPLYEPIVFTEKAAPPAKLPVEKPVFALSTLAYPQFALLP